MKPEQIYQELKNLAEKLGIVVSEQNLRKTGIHVGSGLCKVKGKAMFVMDKHESLREKILLLADCLRHMPHENFYVVPAIREMILHQGQTVHPDGKGKDEAPSHESVHESV